MPSVLDQLGKMTVVVADTGEVEVVKRLGQVDCTSNPSLVLGTLKDPASEGLVARETEAARVMGLSPEQVAGKLTVAVGTD